MYAIVDIETTGGYAAANGITEIAICVFDGEQIVETYETLINPDQHIPRYIQAFTGINNDMVKEAPRFAEVAEKVHSLLHDKIFVAHNVNFDYSFVKNHLEFHGFVLNCKKLCTVRLSRQIFPGLPSYSLGNLCQSLEIDLTHRHRAGGDAGATVDLFKKLLQNDADNIIKSSLHRNSKEQVLPPNVPKHCFEQLPTTPGVYYFHDQKGKVIYVGKAKNIKSRVNSHFSNNSDSRQRQNFLRHTYAISHQSCATELMACILEAAEIKRLWPAFNRSQKTQEETYGIYDYEDQNGYLRLAIDKKRRHSQPIYSFHYKTEGHNLLRKWVKQYHLCPKLCFLQTDNDICTGIEQHECYGACEKKEVAEVYNTRVQQAIASLSNDETFAVVDKGLHDDELSCIVVEKGCFFGMGYISKEVTITEVSAVKEYLQPMKDNAVIRQLIRRFTERNKKNVIFYSVTVTHES